MASIITATTTNGLTHSADNSGVLQLASGVGNLVTVPSVTGTMLTTASTFGGTGPSFSAYLSSNQTVSANTAVKVPFNTEEWDTASCYDNATNYRFTPNVAGYYQFSALVGFGNGPTRAFLYLYKNGADYKRGNDMGSTTNGLNLTAMAYANGTTDYFEIYMYTNNGSGANLLGTQSICYFQAALVRSA